MLFGTAGIPHSSKDHDSASGIARLKELGLDAMELEFVRGVHMSEKTAGEIGETAKEKGILLRVHAPYFINLNSKEKSKLDASKRRILDSARIGEKAGAKIVTFHPGFFQGQDKQEVLEKVMGEIEGLAEHVEGEGWSIRLAPETTGKPTQVGSLEETLEMCRKVKGLLPMIDFSHLHARDNGRFKEKKDFLETIEKIPGKYLKGLQMHASGIRFTAKGERNHLNMEEDGNTFNYKHFIEALKQKRVSGCVICESPNLEDDAFLMKKHWEKSTG